MRIDVVGKHMEVTDAIREYAETKMEKLLRFFDGTQHISVVIEEVKHREFAVEVVVDVVKHDDLVAHARDDDLYAAIDLAADKAERQIRDYKEKLRLR
jgi:putative sigma-54 modulation protein